MSIGKASVAFLLLALAACDSYPRDIDGTSERVRRTGVVRVALAYLEPDQRAIAERYAERVAAAAGARVEYLPNGSSESLFARLEEGGLDLVVAEVATDSPWAAEVALLDPLSRRRAGERVLAVRPVAENGENAWIALLEREARDLEQGR